MKNIVLVMIVSLSSFFVHAQQADSDKKDSLGHARVLIPVNVSKMKPASVMKKVVQSSENNPTQPAKVATVNTKPASERKN